MLTTATTAFEVDGDELDQADALAAMADAGAGMPTVAHGVYNVSARTFTADRVLAGDSVPGATFDGVIGNVTARNGNQLTVRGGTVIRTDDSVVFARGDITVDVGPGTVVTKEGGGLVTLDIGAISVGQRISALGTATSSDVNPTLNATAGRVRLQLTHLTGTVVDKNTGELSLDLFAIDGRNPLFFDFDNTGSSAVTDADPVNYQVATGALDIGGFAVDDSARAFGFMTPFGAAPPDFTARTIVHGDDIRALLGIAWGLGGTEAPFSSMGRDGFIVDIANTDIGLRRFLQVGPRIVDIRTLALAHPGGARDRGPDAVCGHPRPRGPGLHRLRGLRPAREQPADRRLEHAGAHRAGIVRRGLDDADGELRLDHLHGAVGGTVRLRLRRRGQSPGTLPDQGPRRVARAFLFAKPSDNQTAGQLPGHHDSSAFPTFSRGLPRIADVNTL